MISTKRQLIGYLGLIAYWLSIPLAQAQDNPTTLDDLVFVVEQPFNRDQLLTAMDQFHTDTGVGLAIATVYENDVYTAPAQHVEAEWLQRELGVSLFVTLNRNKAYLRCDIQVTPAVELLLPQEDRQRIRQDFMEYYFLGDYTTDDAFTQGVLAGIAEMGKSILNSKKKVDGSEEIVVEVLEHLDGIISARIKDSSIPLPACMPEREEELAMMAEQALTYTKKPTDLLAAFHADDFTWIEQFVTKRGNSPQNSYQSALTDEEWSDLACKVVSYLSDMAEGRGDVAGSRSKALKILIEGFRAAHLRGEGSFLVALDRIRDETDRLYSIPGINAFRVSVTDVRPSVVYPAEEAISTKYQLKEAIEPEEIAGVSFTNQAVFQIYESGWFISDAPQWLLHTHSNVMVAQGLDSKTLLADYLSGRYNYEDIQAVVNKIIVSHEQGIEMLDLNGALASRSVYARNVDFGDKGYYDLYIQRSGNISEDVSSFYSYTKAAVTEVMGFSEDFTEYKITNSSGGVTTITTPSSKARDFEKKVLKLHSAKSGKWYLDMLTAIRTANLNEDDRADLTEFGGDGKLSSVFKVTHEDQKIRLMVGKPLLGKGMTNEVNTTLQPSFTVGTVDNAIGKAYKWQKYEFLNASGKGSSHNTTVSVSTAQAELFESYMLLPKETSEILIDGINWRSQYNNYFSSYTCFKPKNQCCYQAAKVIVEQFSVTTDRLHSIDVAELVSPTNFATVKATSEFERGLKYLEETIKPNKQGGKPVVVGVHYDKAGGSYNRNDATRHFIVIVGKGYDKASRRKYFIFYEVGVRDTDILSAKSSENKLYVDESQRRIVGQKGKKTYTVTEVRENF